MPCGTFIGRLCSQRLGVRRVMISCTAPNGHNDEQNTRPHNSVVTTVNTTSISNGRLFMMATGPCSSTPVMCATDRKPASIMPRYTSVSDSAAQRQRALLRKNATSTSVKISNDMATLSHGVTTQGGLLRNLRITLFSARMMRSISCPVRIGSLRARSMPSPLGRNAR